MIKFNPQLSMEDLNKEELKVYNRLIDGMEGTIEKEAETTAKILEVFIEYDKLKYDKCIRCDYVFSEEDKKKKKIYCIPCLKEMWSLA